jgi:hypothetical protein
MIDEARKVSRPEKVYGKTVLRQILRLHLLITV